MWVHGCLASRPSWVSWSTEFGTPGVHGHLGSLRDLASCEFMASGFLLAWFRSPGSGSLAWLVTWDPRYALPGSLGLTLHTGDVWVEFAWVELSQGGILVGLFASARSP